MNASLVGIHAKIARAEKHLNEFTTEWQDASRLATHVRMVSIEELPEVRRVIIDVTSGELPPEIGIPIGDAVHNLRSCLDHLMCQLAIAAGNAFGCEQTQFPIFSEDTRDTRNRMERWTRHISAPARARIQELQPHQRKPSDPSSDLLSILSSLDNIDKHRLLLVARPHFIDVQFEFAIDGHWRKIRMGKTPGWQPLKLGTEPLRMRLGIPWDFTKPETDIEVRATPVVSPVFQKTGLKCDGWAVFNTVSDMIGDVKSIVDSFVSLGLL